MKCRIPYKAAVCASVGDHPAMYFDVNPDKEYGYEIRRVGD